MSTLRFRVVEKAFQAKPMEVPAPDKRPGEYFGKYVFNREKMFKYLPSTVFARLIDAMDNGAALDRQIADAVAEGMKRWASELGATHYTHWFQPLTEGTAEKHDAFVEHDGKGGMMEEFSGKLLVQQEPDASSFPNGGIRNTFEARGYSAWDPSSPVFVVDDTLCIPTIFIAYTGESLDYKAPLLKALRAVNKAAVDVCHYFDPSVKKVMAYLGWEQEYFLVDEGLYAARPDLLLTGRTLMGHEASKNQQLEDHYFGAIPTRVAAFMKDLEIQALELGIPVKTRHNEVAPNQFELAPIFEECNLAVDHNMLIMSLMRKVARTHGFRVLLHEKPFKGVNGSGKHNNWSLGTDTGTLLMAPGKTPEENLRFITFIVNTLMAVYRHNGLLKASIMSATNAHRLGANEAPPAIISSFLGSQLSKVLDHMEDSSTDELIALGGKHGMKLDIPQIPELLIDNTDRNRTSPFAFTGNRFEFRAVGSEANCASAMIALNTAVAEQLTEFKKEVDELIEKGEPKISAIIQVIRKYIKISKPIRFDGNGYSDEWKEEAARRGLDCETSCPVIFDQYLTEDSVRMFESAGVMTRKELEARNEVKWETYTKKIQIEARVLGDLVMNHVVPVAIEYQSKLIDNVYKMKQIFPTEEAEKLSAENMAIIRKIAEHTSYIKEHVDTMVEARKVANKIVDERAKAIEYHDKITPMLEQIRYHIDKLELIVDDQMWTLPKYRELLFIR
ncbi:glutamine synthetase III [Phocaeicola plebeius]|jgi:glutamine synthetase|uniref:Glutamine synthetase type III n=1 Tax=Phocaeicola plebeius TaxID=310297 RepID=A0A3E4N5U7_9BACT|nr:glutamine synthetase III [Phocaeicola plebeius]MBD9352358.1 glutamine synthetase type III [Phocaeicola plebeius]RGK57563.1 glutamine synthetase type III [Phocaeicola plebeius]RGM37606.1 glutamine synthetase type III [Phocaeicola plebeius]RGQ72093.1 glutamine synthetase type III [Phocaeicola plebeius]RGQ91424.1 glutamine synthetase type III [Phocaeicola plebeius]